MKRLLTHLASVTSAWRRVLGLLWHTQPWFVMGLLVLTVLGGLMPSAQIQLTSAIVGSAALAVRAGDIQHLVTIALLFGIAQSVLLLGTQELLPIPLIFCRMILDLFGSPRGGKTENVGQVADERESQQTFLTLSTHGSLSLSVQ